jgi:hypothetical protein
MWLDAGTVYCPRHQMRHLVRYGLIDKGLAVFRQHCLIVTDNPITLRVEARHARCLTAQVEAYMRLWHADAEMVNRQTDQMSRIGKGLLLERCVC